MKGVYLICLFLIIISIDVYALTVINEVLYNPEGSDNNKEFVEIYSDEELNLTNYIIEDAASDDKLEQIQYRNSSFSLIVEEGFDYSGINVSIYSVGATIGNNLNNDKDIIVLKDNNSNIIDAISYNSDWGADGNNRSLCRLPDETGLWEECSITAGNTNSIAATDYSMLEITEFLPNPQGSDDASIPNGEWVEIYNNGNTEINLEGFIINDDYGNGLIISGINVLEDNATISADGFLVIYRNGDGKLELNNDGLDSVRLFDSSNNLIDEVSYSNSKEAVSWSKIDGVWKQELPSPNSINIDVEDFNKSILKIEDIYLGKDNEAKFGEELRTKINVYKGSTTKNSIKLWVEKDNAEVSKKSSINVYDRFKNYNLVLSVRLDPNCNNKYGDGTYELVLEGLDKRVDKEFRIEGITESLCETVIRESKRSSEDIVLEFLELPEEIKIDETAVVKLKITNNATDDEKVKVWSYIYSGPRSYSGERETNLQEINLPRNSAVIVELNNEIEEHTEDGDYKLKVKLLKEDRKTSDDFTSTIRLFSEQSEERVVENVEEGSLLTGNTIYKSSDIKARSYGLYFLMGLLIVLIIFITFKKGL